MSNKLVKNQTSDKENYGIELCKLYGKIFIGCGIASFALMIFVSTLPQDYEKYNIPLCFTIWSVVSFVLLAMGIVIVVSAKKSKKFQAWAEKDYNKYAQSIVRREIEKAREKL